MAKQIPATLKSVGGVKALGGGKRRGKRFQAKKETRGHVHRHKADNLHGHLVHGWMQDRSSIPEEPQSKGGGFGVVGLIPGQRAKR